MKTSEAGLAFIAQWEGCELEAYQDVAGYDTIGVGHLIVDGEDFSGGITREQAMELLAEDVGHAEDCVNLYVTVPLSQTQFDVLADFVFNLGGGNFRRSTLLRRLNGGDYDAVPHELKRWNRAGGRVVQGLVNRRAAEAELWQSDEP